MEDNVESIMFAAYISFSFVTHQAYFNAVGSTSKCIVGLKAFEDELWEGDGSRTTMLVMVAKVQLHTLDKLLLTIHP